MLIRVHGLEELRINSEFQPYRGSVRFPLPSAVRLLFFCVVQSWFSVLLIQLLRADCSSHFPFSLSVPVVPLGHGHSAPFRWLRHRTSHPPLRARYSPHPSRRRALRHCIRRCCRRRRCVCRRSTRHRCSRYCRRCTRCNLPRRHRCSRPHCLRGRRCATSRDFDPLRGCCHRC